eukprot:m51a1_g6344 hypothetical protein (306) ;mRNA; r:42720-52249
MMGPNRAGLHDIYFWDVCCMETRKQTTLLQSGSVYWAFVKNQWTLVVLLNLVILVNTSMKKQLSSLILELQFAVTGQQNNMVIIIPCGPVARQQQDEVIKSLQAARTKLKEKIAVYKKDLHKCCSSNTSAATLCIKDTDVCCTDVLGSCPSKHVCCSWPAVGYYGCCSRCCSRAPGCTPPPNTATSRSTSAPAMEFEELRCPSCRELLSDPVFLPCPAAHTVCRKCAEEVMRRAGPKCQCPACRQPCVGALRPNAAARESVAQLSRLCAHHQQPLTFLCRVDNDLVCHACLSSASDDDSEGDDVE